MPSDMLQEDETMNIDILLDSDASASEVVTVAAVAREEGIQGSVQPAWSSRGLEESPWVICLLMPVGVFLSAFLSAAGKDAYAGIRRLISRLFGARRNTNGSVEFWDDKTKTHIILSADLSEEAYAQLAQKGVEQLMGGYWTWDSGVSEWKRL